MTIFKKLTAAMLTAVMCVSLASCGDTSWAISADGEKVPAGIYLLNQVQALSDAQYKEGYDAELKDIWKNKIEEKDLGTWIIDTATQKTKEYALIEKMFTDGGLTLSDADQEAIDYTVKQNWARIDYKGVAKSSFESLIANEYKYRAVFDSYYGSNGSESVPEDQLMSHYETNYARLHMITFSLTGSDGTALDEDGKAKVKETADAYLKRAQDGEDMATLIKDYTIQKAKDREEEAPADEDINTEVMTIKKGQVDIYNYVPEKISTAVFETAKPDEPVIFNDDNAYYLITRYDVTKDPAAFEQMRTTLLYDLKKDDFDKIVTEKTKEINFETNENAMKQFKPKKLIKE